MVGVRRDARAPCSCRWPTGSPTSATCSASTPGCGCGGGRRRTGGSTSCSPPARPTWSTTRRARPAWGYEQHDATLSRDPDIRLPRTADLVPPECSPTCCSTASTVRRRTPAARRAASPASTRSGCGSSRPRAQSSIDHVDLWADPDTGVPLRVEVYADGPDDAGLHQSAFAEFSATSRRSSARVASTPPRGVDVEFDDVLDIADAANQYAPGPARPTRSPGWRRRRQADRAVGVYGSRRDPAASPSRCATARPTPLREQLRDHAAASTQVRQRHAGHRRAARGAADRRRRATAAGCWPARVTADDAGPRRPTTCCPGPVIVDDGRATSDRR